MKKLLLLTGASLLLIAGFAQSSGDKNLQTRTVSGFHGISVSGGIDLYLTAGQESVAVSASDESYRDHIKTEVEDGILKIFLEKGYYRTRGNAKLKAFVSLASFDKLSASGGSDVFLQSAFTSKDLQVNLSGGSDLKGKLSADNLEIVQSGGSDVNLTGAVKILAVEASGGSDLHGYDLVAENATIRSSGGSDATVTVNKELKVMASGGSEVYYKGPATVREIKSSGSSSVVKKG